MPHEEFEIDFDALAPKKTKKRTRPKRATYKVALARISERALVATEEAVRAFQPTELDLAITESMLRGKIYFKDIAEDLEMAPATISNQLKDVVACAWISQMVHSNIRHRLGFIDASMNGRALAGDVNAAKLMYKRYDQIVDRSVVQVQKLDFDPTQLSDDELLTLTTEYTVRQDKLKAIDTECTSPKSTPTAPSASSPPPSSQPSSEEIPTP